ncbi:bifunctional UDP-sugar hydrolase/5'-nucleotidase [Bacillus sp. FJAT-49736]|uniref:bifunctional metallophosphatase/5'-nucleotidase n=1 Tax=Bacillus sp. FJAT-49736 TaxID=2833582 RepID=UPI001BC967E2|nr:bifunctional UDP-sugar hydrolase/5'-nucleotidase [Bacillus sp. FJAT-49736]MBS4173952.1 bifunctional metallophosphatase/5'-nucleotidase [Bacillus sp. FJAT-49736]
MIEQVHIYHTNDVHSHFENWPKIRTFLQRKKSLYKDKDNFLLFDIGDHVDRWHPYTEGTVGKGNVQLLNELGYTAVTIGNNEGITLSHTELDSLYKEAKFDVLVANLFNQSGKRPNWAMPYNIYTTKNGINIGVLAVTADFGKLYELLGWRLTEPIPQVAAELQYMRKIADIIIVLSHLGIYEDEKMANLYPEIDIILGGHTHHVLPEGKMIHNTLLAAAGKHGNYVGKVSVTIDTHRKKLIDKSALLYNTKQLPAPKEEERDIVAFQSEGKQLLNSVLVNLPETLEIDWFGPSLLSKILCEAINEWCESDCAFINVGLLLGNLQKGNVTRYDIHSILPHPINPCLIELSGAELKDVLLQTLDSKWPTLELKGLGFRGKILGNFIYHNITIRNQNLFIKGKPLEENKKYTLGTVDMYTFGHFFPQLLEAKKKYFMPEFIRDVMIWKLQKKYGDL